MKGMETFIAIAASKTLNEAAHWMQLSPSAVSHALKNLEQSLGVELVDRKKGLKQITLTPAGKELLPLAIRYNDVVNEIQHITSSMRHKISIGSVESINHCLFPDFLPGLEKYDLDFRIETNTSIELQRQVENGEIDVAFVINQTPSLNLDISTFLVEDMKVIRRLDCSSLPNDLEVIDAASLDPSFEVYVNWNLSFQIWHDSIWSKHRRARFQTNSMVHIESFLVDERYWIIAPESVARFFEKKGLYVQDIHPAPPERLCYKITRHSISQYSAPALKIFDDVLNEWKRNIT